MSEISYYVASCLPSGFLTRSADYKCRSEIKNSKTRKYNGGEPEQADMEILSLMSDVITSFRVTNKKNQPLDFKQLTRHARRANRCLNDCTLNSSSKRILHVNCTETALRS